MANLKDFLEMNAMDMSEAERSEWLSTYQSIRLWTTVCVSVVLVVACVFTYLHFQEPQAFTRDDCQSMLVREKKQVCQRIETIDEQVDRLEQGPCW